MKKRALVSLVLLTFVTAGAVFAQSPTLDKLTFVAKRSGGKDYYEVKAANKSISGAVVIPGTYNNIPVTEFPSQAFLDCGNITSVSIPASVTSIGNMAFRSCTGLTSVTIPNGVTSIGNSAFNGCTNLASVTIPASVTSIGQLAFHTCAKLTSVTFGGSNTGMVKSPSSQISFPGDLHIAYQAGGAGTYTRPANGNNWTKQGAANAPAPAVNTSLDGWWVSSSGLTIIVSGNSATFLYFGTNPRWQDALKKGYVKGGDQKLRNIRSTGNLTWTMEELSVEYNTRSPDVATGVKWFGSTYTMSANGQTLSENGSVVWTRTEPHQ